MSLYGDILDELLGEVRMAVPTARTVRGFTPLREITEGPYAYAYMQEVQHEPLDFGQERRTHAAVIVFVSLGNDQESVYTDVQSILDQLGSGSLRTLDGAVDTIRIGQVQLFEAPKPGGHAGASILVECVRDV